MTFVIGSHGDHGTLVAGHVEAATEKDQEVFAAEQ